MTPWIALLVAVGSGTTMLATLPADLRGDRTETLELPIRALVRPMSMPATWLWLDSSGTAGRSEEELAATRNLLDVVPDWVAGHTHHAWILGLDLRRDEADPARRADLVLAASQDLQSEAERFGDPQDRVELLLSASTLLLHAADTDDELARSYAHRFGASLEDHAREVAGRAVEISSDEVTRGRLADASTASLRSALAQGRIDRAELMRATALRLFRTVDAPSARRLADSLEQLGPLPAALEEARTQAPRLEALAAEAPWLASVIEDLRELARSLAPDPEGGR